MAPSWIRSWPDQRFHRCRHKPPGTEPFYGISLCPSPEGTLFELASNGLTARQGTDRLGGISVDLGKICGLRHQRRTSLMQAIRRLVVAVGIGVKFGSSF